MVTLKAHILPHPDLQPPGCRGSEVVARTGFHELVRGLARYLTGGHFRLLPDGFWCQNRRESDPAHYLRRYRDVFLSTGGTFQRPDITAIQRGGRPVNKAVCIK